MQTFEERVFNIRKEYLEAPSNIVHNSDWGNFLEFKEAFLEW